MAEGRESSSESWRVKGRRRRAVTDSEVMVFLGGYLSPLLKWSISVSDIWVEMDVY